MTLDKVGWPSDRPVKPGLVFGAEVLNLTVVIGGTPEGIHRHRPQRRTAAHPQRASSTWDRPTRRRYRHYKTHAPIRVPVLGRYALHFQQCDEGSDGSLVENVVVTKSHTHAFVPRLEQCHLPRCIAHDTHLSAFWWDNSNHNNGFQSVNDETDRTSCENCVGSLQHDFPAVPALEAESMVENMSGGPPLPDRGKENAAKGCVAVGNTSSCVAKNSGRHGRAVFGCSTTTSLTTSRAWAHRCGTTPMPATRSSATSPTHRRAGVKHGAYHNNYNYRDCTFYGNGLAGVMLFANTRRLPGRLLFKGCIVNAAGLVRVRPRRRPAPPRVVLCGLIARAVRELRVRRRHRRRWPSRTKPITTCKWDFVNCR